MRGPVGCLLVRLRGPAAMAVIRSWGSGGRSVSAVGAAGGGCGLGQEVVTGGAKDDGEGDLVRVDAQVLGRVTARVMSAL